MSDAIFVRDGGTLVPTGHAVGPWDSSQLHGGAPAGLAANAIAALVPELHLARAAFEFLGPVPFAPLTLQAAVTKPGRRFALAEATLAGPDGRTVLQARGVLLRRGEAMALPEAAHWADAARFEAPHLGAPSPFDPGEDGLDGFHLSGMEIRDARPGDEGTGRGSAWFRLAHPFVEGETTHPVVRAIAAGDFANGISRVLSFETHLFVNCDLTVTMLRPPEGEWVLLDATTRIDPAGIGLTSGVLHDLDGPLGFAQQTLFVAPR